jgi:precorrin-6B methylase 2
MPVDPQSPNRILRIGFGFQAASVLLAANKVGVFACLARNPATLGQLSAELRLHPRFAEDFLDSMVALKLLRRDAAGRYDNTADGAEFLVPGRPHYLGSLFRLMERNEYVSWGELSAALVDGLPRGRGALGDDLYGTLYDSEAHLREFASSMTALNLMAAPALATAIEWKRYATFADIGCAQGAQSVQLALAHRHLTGTGFDLPAVAGIFNEYAQRHGVADRLTFQDGDFFAGELPVADVHLFGHVLHNWSAGQRRELCDKSYRALNGHGAIIVQEAFIDDERRGNVSGLLMSLHMRLQTRDGFDSTTRDCRMWLEQAGFEQIQVLPLTGPDSIVVGFKP